MQAHSPPPSSSHPASTSPSLPSPSTTTPSSSPPRIRATILVSGSGTNLQALIDATLPNQPLHNLQIVRVLTDRKDGLVGLARATKAGIPTAELRSYPYRQNTVPGRTFEKATEEERKNFKEPWRRAYDRDLAEMVGADGPEVVVCAGFMHVYTTDFLTPFTTTSPPSPILNLHPSLPASYPAEHLPGANSLARAYDLFTAGKITKTGMMIHYVVEEVDAGEPIVVEEVPFTEADKKDKAGFEKRFHEREWVAIVEGVRRVVEGLVLTKEKEKGEREAS